MLIFKIATCILALVFFVIARKIYHNNYDIPSKASTGVAIIAFVLSIAFCVLMIMYGWCAFTIPRILLFIAACLFILFVGTDLSIGIFFAVIATIVVHIICGIVYLCNFKMSDTPEITTTSTILVCAKDDYSINGNLFGSILYVQGSVSEKAVYKYYYKLPDGGIKQGSIPAKDTTIYFIKDGEEPRLDTVVATYYNMNHNTNPPKQCGAYPTTTYELYVPEGSVDNIYEFNAE